MKKSSPPSSPLKLSALTPTALRSLADDKSFARGEAYFAEGRVVTLEERSGKIVALVEGTDSYVVQLWQVDDELAYDCSCPIGREGDFCKHCVAVGLALLAARIPVRKSQDSPRLDISLDAVRRDLEGESKAALVDLIVERAAADPSLLDQLRLRVAKRRHRGSVDIPAIQGVLRRAITPRGFLSRREVGRYVNEIHGVIDPLEALIQEGKDVAAIELVEYALEQVEQAMGSVDDSDGDLSGVLERLQELHHRACKQARPDPVALAKRLFEWELRSPWEVFFGAAVRYADVLGPKGLAEYRRLATERWDTVPSLEPGQRGRDEYGGRFRITTIMRTLARQAGDVEAEAQVLQRDLSSAYCFLEIATLYQQAGQDDQALAWAEKGVAAFPRQTDRRLRQFLAEEYHRRERHQDAMELAWAAFCELPSLQEYKQLKAHAERAKAWPEWRDKALAAIRAQIAENRRKAKNPAWGPLTDNSLLVEIYLAEGDPEAAWEEALAGDCSALLWLALAERRERAHPEDALPIYKRQLQITLAMTNNAAYETGIHLLHKIRAVMGRLGQKESFAAYLASVRAAFARKRNFIRLLEETQWT
jgi:uncharacterized Zn finger protein